MPWDNLEQGLVSRVRSCAAERQAQEQGRRYDAWASQAIDVCLDDLSRELTERIARFDEEVRGSLTISTVYPSHANDSPRVGIQRVLCLSLDGDEVHIHGQWRPGQAPTLHLLWSRRRQGRYCQMVPIEGGRLMPQAVDNANETSDSETLSQPALTGYRLVASGSSDEISPDRLLFRALGLLASGAR